MTSAQIRRALFLKKLIDWRTELDGCEAKLTTFLRAAWPQFDSSAYVHGWHLDAIADHLAAVSNGQIRRLLINIPPRFGKTNLVSVAWPVWTWCLEPSEEFPLHGPGVRFLCASYGANKAEADGVTARRLIGSQWFQERWGERVKICFPYDQTIQTEDGPRAIGEIVERRQAINVPSWNEQTQQIELRPIVGWHVNPGAPIYRLRFDNGVVIRCTGDHSFRMASGNWLAANEIPIGAHALSIRSDEALGRERPGSARLDTPHLGLGNPVALGQHRLLLDAGVDRPRILDSDLGHPPARFEGAMGQGVFDVLGAGAVFQVALVAIRRVAVAMANLLPVWRRAYEIPRDQLMHLCLHWLPVAHQVQMGIPMTVGWRLQDCFASDPPLRPPGLHPEGGSGQRLHTAEVRDHVAGEVPQADPDFTRLVSIDHDGYAPTTYCITVAHNHNLIAGGDLGLILANCRDRDNQSQYDTHAGGSRISTGIPESLGKGGAIRLIDDPHKTDEVESDLVRQGVIRAYDEVWRTRSNDPLYGAEVIVMQRLSEGDLSGHVLEEPDVVHLMLPLEYDSRRHCHTVIGFDDPRKNEGDLLWPERFDESWVRKQQQTVGPHAFAGQYQQEPTARGGGIVQRDWWKVWPPEGQEDSWTSHVEVAGKTVARMQFPPLNYVLLSVDTAYTEKEENDWSACTVWGSFEDAARNPKIILMEAWRERLEMRALVMKIIDTARRRKADAVLIETKASGLSVIQEMRRLMRAGEFTIFGEAPRGDKVARLHAVSAAFSAGLVYAPNRKWADMVIDEVAQFPRSKWKDLTDTVSAAVKKLRDIGVVQHTDEVTEEREEALLFRGQQPNLRAEYGV